MARGGVISMHDIEMKYDRRMVLVAAILNQLAVDIGDRIRAGKEESDPITRAMLKSSEPLFEWIGLWCPTCSYATPAGLLRLARHHAKRSAKFVRDYTARRTPEPSLTGDEEKDKWARDWARRRRPAI